MIKNENGSALLTVILIAFVTATLGAAISSFIMMNYKLRMIDINIGKAEYEAETIQAYAYVAVVEAMKELLEFANENAEQYSYLACDYAHANIKDAPTSPLTLIPGILDEQHQIEGWTVEDVAIYESNAASTKANAPDELEKEYYKRIFDVELGQKAFDKDKDDRYLLKKIYNKLDGKYDFLGYTEDETEFNRYFIERNDGVALYLKRIEATNNFTLYIYYKKEGVTPVYLSGDFIIIIPECNTENGLTVDHKYDAKNQVVMTNVEFRDWGI